MSTNGVVIITDGDNNIHAKVIAGCNGFAARELARVLVGSGANTLQAIYDLAHFADFGCRGCLVVMSATEAVKLFEDDIPQRYWDSYWYADVNPIDPAGSVGWEFRELVSLADIMQMEAA
jgi:hypothetical protein